uniref:Uncharacterized protein n=1 Tax=Vitis vinifera TaxID=29760 RepID=F6H9V6_VITVI
MKKRRRSDFSQKHSDSVPKCYVSVDLSVLGLLLTSEKYHGMSGVGKSFKNVHPNSVDPNEEHSPPYYNLD